MSKNKQLLRVAKGKRPQYFEDLATDNLLSMVLVLAQELSVAMDRIDTLEQVLSEGGDVSLDILRAFEPSDAVRQRREEDREMMLRRLFRATEEEHQNRTNGSDKDAADSTQ